MSFGVSFEDFNKLCYLFLVELVTLWSAMNVKTSSGFIRSVFLPSWLRFCEVVYNVFSERPLFFIASKVFIILSSCFTPSVWARGLVTMSEGCISVSEWLVRIKTLACEAGDPGFKSPRAR